MSLLDSTLSRPFEYASPSPQPTDRRKRSVDGRAANVLGGVFYLVVAAIALAGQTGAAVYWLGWPWMAALPAVAALELGGIALAARADFRRRLGETAYTARILSAAVAIFAVVFNWVGHQDKLQGGFFAGMSALGYAVWLINAEDRRRDHLREMGNLPPPAPVYGLWQWIRHPWLTHRARGLARQHPRLGLYGSLSEASTQKRAERRRSAIARTLEARLRKTLDSDTAAIAVATYDLDAIAERIAAAADYDRVASLVAADLYPERITNPAAYQRVTAPPTTQPSLEMGASMPELGTAVDLAASRRARPAAAVASEPAPRASKAAPATTTQRKRGPKVPKTADAYANWLRIWRDFETNGGTNAEVAARNGGPSTRLISEIRSAGQAGLLSEDILHEITSTGRASSLASRNALLDTGELRVLENVRAVPAA
jgi:hypothetical protein